MEPVSLPYKEVVRNILELNYSVAISKEVNLSLKGVNVNFDFADVENRFFAAFFDLNKLGRVNFVAEIKKIRNTLLLRFKQDYSVFVLIFPYDLSLPDRTFVNECLKKEKLKAVALEKRGLISLAKKFPENITSDEEKLIRGNGLRKEEPVMVETGAAGNNYIKAKKGIEDDKRRIDSKKEARISLLGVTCWWLNADEANWPLRKAEKGSVWNYYKKTKLSNGKLRTRNGFNQIKPGDFVISYQKSPHKRLAAIYIVVKPEKEEHLSFLFVKELQKKTTWDELGKLAYFKGTAVKKMNATGSAHKLTSGLWSDLVKLSEGFDETIKQIREAYKKHQNKPPVIKHTPTPVGPAGVIIENPRSEAISTDYGGKDSLGFEKDVQSLAALVALEELKPPLALALFGKWGSGKSFFMRSIEQRVQELSQYQAFVADDGQLSRRGNQKQEKLFVEGIAHIKFNAWSYLDANLWAGLAHSMFEKLDLYINDNTKGGLERMKIQVKIAKRLEVLHSEKDKFLDKKEHLEGFRDELKRQKRTEYIDYFSEEYDQKFIELFDANSLNSLLHNQSLIGFYS